MWFTFHSWLQTWVEICCIPALLCIWLLISQSLVICLVGPFMHLLFVFRSNIDFRQTSTIYTCLHSWHLHLFYSVDSSFQPHKCMFFFWQNGDGIVIYIKVIFMCLCGIKWHNLCTIELCCFMDCDLTGIERLSTAGQGRRTDYLT